MQESMEDRWTPAIMVGSVDQERLTSLATSASERYPEVAEELIGEIERATVVSDSFLPRNVVRMGSTVEFEAEGGVHRRVTLVYPGDADISVGKISILTPIGTALIGLAEGQSIMWKTRDGRAQLLTVLLVEPPASSSK